MNSKRPHVRVVPVDPDADTLPLIAVEIDLDRSNDHTDLRAFDIADPDPVELHLHLRPEAARRLALHLLLAVEDDPNASPIPAYTIRTVEP